MKARLWWLSISLWLLVACGADAAPRIVTLAPTSTPLEPSMMPSDTPYPTLTIPVMPTITPAPTRQIVTGSGANPLQPTFTAAPPTSAPPIVEEVALANLNIEYFLTNDEEQNLSPADNVTLFWQVNGVNEARIFRLNAEGRRIEVWDVPAEGRLTVSLGSEDLEAPLTAASFMLWAQIGDVTVDQTLTFSLECAAVWFFLPEPDKCPATAPTITQQVEQRFENGLMIWLGESRQIYVFIGAGESQSASWAVFEDRFGEGIPEQDENITPPTERLQPVRGFGLVWRENPEIRERLGWAVEPELGYDGIIQTASDGTIYLRERAGGILVGLPDGEGWQVIPVAEPNQILPTAEVVVPPDEN